MQAALRHPLVVALLVAAALPVGTADGRGHLVLIGGGDAPPEVMATFVRLAGGPTAPLVVIPTASDDPTTGPEMAAELRDVFGCSDVAVLEVRGCNDAARADWVALAERARGIYFTGGDQTRIITAFADSPLLAAIDRAFAAGATLAGTSAGTACMSRLMITGEGDFSVIRASNVELWLGLGFLPGVIVDQHFVARQRQNRLLAVTLEHPALLGVGVDEGTAIWVRPDLTFSVLGLGTVTVVDATGATVVRPPAPEGDGALGGHGLKLDLLVAGDVYDLVGRRVVASAPTVPWSPGVAR